MTFKLQIVKDWQLVLLACAVVAVSIILVAIENAVPIFRPHPTIVPDRERGSSVNVSYMHKISPNLSFLIFTCDSVLKRVGCMACQNTISDYES